MPTYVYRREDGSTFEIEQRITADALETCPDTGQKVERIITGSAGLIFKGSGFYLTDYVRNDKGSGSASKPTSAGESSTSEGSSTEGSASGSNASGGESSGAGTSGGGSKDSSSGTNASSNT